MTRKWAKCVADETLALTVLTLVESLLCSILYIFPFLSSTTCAPIHWELARQHGKRIKWEKVPFWFEKWFLCRKTRSLWFRKENSTILLPQSFVFLLVSFFFFIPYASSFLASGMFLSLPTSFSSFWLPAIFFFFFVLAARFFLLFLRFYAACFVCFVCLLNALVCMGQGVRIVV